MEPYSGAQTMEMHQNKHHTSYVIKLNNAIKDTELSIKSIEDLLDNI